MTSELKRKRVQSAECTVLVVYIVLYTVLYITVLYSAHRRVA